MIEEKRLSTTQLAKQRGIPQDQLFALLSQQGLIEKKDDKWILTDAGGKLVVWKTALKFLQLLLIKSVGIFQQN